MNQPPYTPLDHWEAWANKHECVPLQTDWQAVAADQAMTIALLKSEQQAEPVISTAHGPWIPSTHPGEEGESYCKRCLLRDKFLGSRQCDPHIVPPEQPARHRHISYVCPQCHWSLEEQPAPAPEVREQQEPVAWLAKTQTQYPAGTHPLIFTDKAAADRWLSDFTQGFAWLEPLYLRPPQVNI